MNPAVIALRNVSGLVFLALPGLFLAAWLWAIVQRVEGSLEAGYMLESGLFHFLYLTVPVAMGGILQQAGMFALTRGMSRRGQRAVAVITSLLLGAGVGVASFPLVVLGWFALPAGLVFLVYGLLQATPASAMGNAQGATPS